MVKYTVSAQEKEETRKIQYHFAYFSLLFYPHFVRNFDPDVSFIELFRYVFPRSSFTQQQTFVPTGDGNSELKFRCLGSKLINVKSYSPPPMPLLIKNGNKH